MLKNILLDISKNAQNKPQTLERVFLLNAHKAIREECLARAYKGETQISLSYERSDLGNILSNFIISSGVFLIPNLRDLFELLQADGVSSVRVGNELILNWA